MFLDRIYALPKAFLPLTERHFKYSFGMLTRVQIKSQKDQDNMHIYLTKARTIQRRKTKHVKTFSLVNKQPLHDFNLQKHAILGNCRTILFPFLWITF